MSKFNIQWITNVEYCRSMMLSFFAALGVYKNDMGVFDQHRFVLLKDVILSCSICIRLDI